MIALLINNIAQEMNFQFQHYQIVPSGNQSKVVNLSDDSQYELFGDNLFHLFWASRYDKAMQGILDCIDQLIKQIKKKDQGFVYPFPGIKKENVKLQFNSDEKWTKSIKYTLTNLKYIVAWISLNKPYKSNNVQ